MSCTALWHCVFESCWEKVLKVLIIRKNTNYGWQWILTRIIVVIISQYIWSLNNTDFNCSGSFICGFVSINTVSPLYPQILHLWIQPTTDPNRIFVCGSFVQQSPPQPSQMRISLPRHDLLEEEKGVSQSRRALSLFLNGLSICTGIQVKLINHCQAVRIKQ